MSKSKLTGLYQSKPLSKNCVSVISSHLCRHFPLPLYTALAPVFFFFFHYCSTYWCVCVCVCAYEWRCTRQASLWTEGCTWLSSTCLVYPQPRCFHLFPLLLHFSFHCVSLFIVIFSFSILFYSFLAAFFVSTDLPISSPFSLALVRY